MYCDSLFVEMKIFETGFAIPSGVWYQIIIDQLFNTYPTQFHRVTKPFNTKKNYVIIQVL